MSASEAAGSPPNETMIETFSSFGNVSSVRIREAVSIDFTQNENEMHGWTQRETEKLPN